MAEEFQESEIFFSEHKKDNYRDMMMMMQQLHTMNKIKNNKNNMSCSLPLNIHHNHQRVVFKQFTGSEDDDDDYEEDDDEIVPPHVIVSRRVSRDMQFSVCTGNGRTLKGRDLSHVRNSILKMTGFLET